MTDTPASTRRSFLRHTARLAAVGALPALSNAARASLAGPRELALLHTHTHEQIEIVYAVGDRYDPEALGTLNRFLRDHYTGDVGRIDPGVFDLLYRAQQMFGSRRSFEVISGYRCPTTNTQLRLTRGGGVARNSLHMEGRAIDVRLSGVPVADLRDAALSLRAGGVGFYPRERFVHLDTGRVRHW
jgi:uncharacterized protein YcbK (DUF882 family)